MTDYSHKVGELFDSQFREWKLARDNYGQLDGVLVRTVSFPGYDISVQFNPGRITSSAAKVDTRSIEARPCFLCEKNRPAEQRGVRYGEDYIILINPFPIFRRHLTIVSQYHTPQRIAGNFETMLRLTEALPEYVIFYNGPECGASAPDHLHFQAGNRGFLPIERDTDNPELCRKVAVIERTLLSGRVDAIDSDGLLPGLAVIASPELSGKMASQGTTELWLWSSYNRGIMTLRGTDCPALSQAFDSFLDRFALLQPDRPEPMLNIVAYHTDGLWTVHIIPRRVHRPACYFAEGNERILLSPASVDIGGVFITPREEDFRKMTAADIHAILDEVCMGEDELTNLTKDLI